MTYLTINGIEMAVEKKSIKNMYIRVIPLDGKVKITAPMHVTGDAIKSFAVSRIEWIKKQQQKIENRPEPMEYQYISGESHYLWGNRYNLDVIYSNTRDSVSLRGQNIILQVSKESTMQQRAYIMNEWYRELLKNAIPQLFEKCERLVGVKAKEWRVKNMKTKWGTCNIKAKRIWLNLQLAKKAPECLEYVIIHELVHLLEKSHNNVFKAYMNNFCPNWREIKKHLNS
jgi:hypothetical protein